MLEQQGVRSAGLEPSWRKNNFFIANGRLLMHSNLPIATSRNFFILHMWCQVCTVGPHESSSASLAWCSIQRLWQWGTFIYLNPSPRQLQIPGASRSLDDPQAETNKPRKVGQIWITSLLTRFSGRGEVSINLSLRVQGGVTYFQTFWLLISILRCCRLRGIILSLGSFWWWKGNLKLYFVTRISLRVLVLWYCKCTWFFSFHWRFQHSTANSCKVSFKENIMSPSSELSAQFEHFGSPKLNYGSHSLYYVKHCWEVQLRAWKHSGTSSNVKTDTCFLLGSSQSSSYLICITTCCNFNGGCHGRTRCTKLTSNASKHTKHSNTWMACIWYCARHAKLQTYRKLHCSLVCCFILPMTSGFPSGALSGISGSI